MSSKRATIIPCGGCHCWESELAESVSPNSAHRSAVTINVTPITSVVLHKTLPPPGDSSVHTRRILGIVTLFLGLSKWNIGIPWKEVFRPPLLSNFERQVVNVTPFSLSFVSERTRKRNSRNLDLWQASSQTFIEASGKKIFLSFLFFFSITLCRARRYL